jgi:hypothetical protein
MMRADALDMCLGDVGSLVEFKEEEAWLCFLLMSDELGFVGKLSAGVDLPLAGE